MWIKWAHGTKMIETKTYGHRNEQLVNKQSYSWTAYNNKQLSFCLLNCHELPTMGPMVPAIVAKAGRHSQTRGGGPSPPVPTGQVQPPWGFWFSGGLLRQVTRKTHADTRSSQPAFNSGITKLGSWTWLVNAWNLREPVFWGIWWGS